MRWGPALPPAGQSGAGPPPIWVLLPTFPAPPTILLLADGMRRGLRARNLRPGARLLCDSALSSRSGVSGMAAFRHTFQQAILPLLARFETFALAQYHLSCGTLSAEQP